MSTPTPASRLYRRRDGRLVAGVASGLADHLGIDVIVVRTGFVVTSVLGGLGALLYAAFWAFVPQQPDDDATPVKLGPRSQLIGFTVLGLCVLIVAQLLGFGAGLLWPAAAAVTGAAILWRQADEAQRDRWRSATARRTRLVSGSGRSRAVLRYGSGVLLVIIGMVTFLAAHSSLQAARTALLPVLVVVLGLLLVLGPWALRTLTQLADERRARIREQERVELAGRVHDSMLQTLTLIQRGAHDPDEVLRLVRHSERELREWLYAPSAPETLSAALAAVRAEIEDEYPVTVDLITVGEYPASPAVQALVQAAREAAINAATHSAVTTIAMYAEVGTDVITVYVRDRGKGFDLETVPSDRYGVRESVIARMERHGGTSTIRTAPGAGTEVRLSLPVNAPIRA